MAESMEPDTPCTTFADALSQRYGDPFDPSGGCVVVGAPGSDREVQLKLHPQQQQIEQLTKRVTLTHKNIESLGHLSDHMRTRLKEVKELDLSFNDLPHWPAIVDIVSQVPACEELILSGNRRIAYPCDFPCSEVIRFKRSMQSVRTIVMAVCEYEWPWVLCAALEVWPSTLATLNLHANQIRDLSPPPASCFASLDSLDLSCNSITDWSHVCHLGSLPS